MTKIEKRLADLKARQEAGEHLPCPRCGRDTMKQPYATNALSRLTDIHVCDQCGTDEAKLAWMGSPGTLYAWKELQPLRPDGDFKAVPAEKAMVAILAVQTQALTELFKRSETEKDSEAVRYDAFEQLKGLRELWASPFEARYSAQGGEVLIRLKRDGEGILIAADVVEGK